MISVIDEEKVDTVEKLDALYKLIGRRNNSGTNKLDADVEELTEDLYNLKFEQDVFNTKIKWDTKMGRIEITELEFKLFTHGRSGSPSNSIMKCY